MKRVQTPNSSFKNKYCTLRVFPTEKIDNKNDTCARLCFYRKAKYFITRLIFARHVSIPFNEIFVTLSECCECIHEYRYNKIVSNYHEQ